MEKWNSELNSAKPILEFQSDYPLRISLHWAEMPGSRSPTSLSRWVQEGHDLEQGGFLQPRQTAVICGCLLTSPPTTGS